MLRPDLIRARILRDIYRWREYASLLDDADIVHRLNGHAGVKRAALITDFVLVELGYALDGHIEGQRLVHREHSLSMRLARGMRQIALD